MRIETEEIDGRERIWFPAISYEVSETGEVLKYPPTGDVRYRIIWSNYHEADDITRAGLTQDARHTGRTQTKIIDNRDAKL